MDSNTSFYLALSSLSSIAGMVLMYIYKSKCSNVSLCFGLISIQRDTHVEGEIDEETGEIQPTI
jgi:hypothetical protein